MHTLFSFKKTPIAFFVGIAFSIGFGRGSAIGDSAQSAESPAAPPVTIYGVRSVTPLLKNWKFTQDDLLSDTQALSDTGTNWSSVTLPHTWNATDAATTTQSYPSTPPYKRGLGWYLLEINGRRRAPPNGCSSMPPALWQTYGSMARSWASIAAHSRLSASM
jgi:beta-galactosidase